VLHLVILITKKKDYKLLISHLNRQCCFEQRWVQSADVMTPGGVLSVAMAMAMAMAKKLTGQSHPLHVTNFSC